MGEVIKTKAGETRQHDSCIANIPVNTILATVNKWKNKA